MWLDISSPYGRPGQAGFSDESSFRGGLSPPFGAVRSSCGARKVNALSLFWHGFGHVLPLPRRQAPGDHCVRCGIADPGGLSALQRHEACGRGLGGMVSHQLSGLEHSRVLPLPPGRWLFHSSLSLLIHLSIHILIHLRIHLLHGLSMAFQWLLMGFRLIFDDFDWRMGRQWTRAWCPRAPVAAWRAWTAC